MADPKINAPVDGAEERDWPELNAKMLYYLRRMCGYSFDASSKDTTVWAVNVILFLAAENEVLRAKLTEGGASDRSKRAAELIDHYAGQALSALIMRGERIDDFAALAETAWEIGAHMVNEYLNRLSRAQQGE